jgi:putative amidoligase enzyme
MPHIDNPSWATSVLSTDHVYYPCVCGCGREAMTYTDICIPQHRQRWYDQLRTRAREGDQQAFNKLYALGLSIDKPILTGFGFEAEFFGIYDEDAVNYLKSAGLEAEADGYHHNTKPYWRVTEDSSVSNEGLELVSPILRLHTLSLTEAKLAVNTLSQGGAVVNRSCGLHVHHSARGMTLLDLIETVIAYSVWGSTIDSLLPYSRRESQWANHYGVRTRRNLTSVVERMMNAGSRGITHYDGLSGAFDRYMTVNLQALAAHGTVEFRQHSGTLNTEKVEHWIRLTRLFMRSRKRGNNIFDLLEVYDYDIDSINAHGIEGMCDYLGTTDATKKFYLKRAEQLTNFREDDEDVGGADEEGEDEPFCDECEDYGHWTSEHEDDY